MHQYFFQDGHRTNQRVAIGSICRDCRVFYRISTSSQTPISNLFSGPGLRIQGSNIMAAVTGILVLVGIFAFAININHCNLLSWGIVDFRTAMHNSGILNFVLTLQSMLTIHIMYMMRGYEDSSLSLSTTKRHPSLYHHYHPYQTPSNWKVKHSGVIDDGH